jgi:hypothetical protein
MFNIEMIGTDSKWGNNQLYYHMKTDMGAIMPKIWGTGFTFILTLILRKIFYRSDNATLARLGVPATIQQNG